MELTSNQISMYRDLFRGRNDVYAKFWKSSDGKSGYMPVYTIQKSTILNDIVIKQHLYGRETIGIYPLLPDNTTHFLVVDFDRLHWLKESVALIQQAQKFGIHSYLERSRSGNGGHVWFFFEENISAFQARQMGKILLERILLSHKSTFDRMFPSQDEHTGKGFGNLIAIPLQGKNVQEGNSCFINLEGELIADQWKLLSQIQKISRTQIDDFLKQQIILPSKNPITGNVNNIEVEEEDFDVKTTNTSIAKLYISNQIYIPESFLPEKVYKFLKSKLVFHNPNYYELGRYPVN